MNYLISLLLSVFVSFNSEANPQPNLSLHEKIGQMLLIGFDETQIDPHSKIVKVIKQNNIGGVILFEKNIQNPTQLKQLNHDLQYFSEQSNLTHHRDPLPLLISIDYEGGRVIRLREQNGFPSTVSAADVGKMSTADANFIAAKMAQTLKDLEFNLNFAPLLDVNVNPENPVIGKRDRSFSSDPALVANFANIYSQHFLKQNIECSYKHFPGHGSSTKDSHLGFVDVTNTWQDYELQPYQQLLNKDMACGMVMTAHIVNLQLDSSGLPATLSHHVLTDLLRSQLQFKGVIISDDMQMKAIADNYGLDEALELAINAGADMFIFGNNLPVTPLNPEDFIKIVEAKVQSGAIREDRINEAYQHIVTFKQSLRKANEKTQQR